MDITGSLPGNTEPPVVETDRRYLPQVKVQLADLLNTDNTEMHAQLHIV